MKIIQFADTNVSRASLRIPPIFPSKECSFSESGNRFTDLFFLLCHFWSLNFRVVCSSNSARIRLARFINKPGAIIMLSSYNCSSRLTDRDRRLSISRSEPSPALSCCIISNAFQRRPFLRALGLERVVSERRTTSIPYDPYSILAARRR